MTTPVPPVYTPPTVIPFPSAFTAPSAGVAYDYTPHFNALNLELSKLVYQLQLLNFYFTSNELPGSPAAINQTSAASLNDMATLMASMLDNQNQLISSVANIQLGLASVASSVNEGVATNQVLTAATIAKNEKDIAENEAALQRQGIEPQVISPAKLTEKIQKTVQDTSVLSVQSKAAGLANQALSDASSKIWTLTTDYVSGTGAAKWVKDKWTDMFGSKAQKVEDTTSAAEAKTKSKARLTKLGL